MLNFKDNAKLMLRIVMCFLVVLAVGCKQHSEKIDETAKLQSLAKTDTTRLLEADGLGVEIFDFDELEPLFHQENDTTYIINFWATWCAPCVKELPYFEKINAEQKEERVAVILVSLDMPTMWKTHLVPFIKKKNIRSKVVILDDPKQNTWIPKVDANWSGGIPATLIYNKDKRVLYEKSFEYEELVKAVNTFK